mgnify:FL=1
MGAAAILQAAGLGWQVGTAIGNAVKGAPGTPGGPPRVGTLSKQQQLFNQSTQHVLEQEQMMLANAASQSGAANEAIYRSLGYAPVYSNDAPDPAALKAGANQSYSDTVTAYTDWQKAKQHYERAKAAAGNSHGTQWAKVLATGGMQGWGKGQPKARAARAAAQELKNANDRLSMSRSTYQSKVDAYQSALTNPRQIVSLNPLGPDANGVTPGHDPNNPDDLMQIALDLGNQSLVRALKGEEPIDQTLVHTFVVAEDNLRERLRRQLGPDYETTTAGSQALNDFSRSKAESFQQFNRGTIAMYANMTDQQAQVLSNLRGADINQLLAPADQTLKVAAALGGSAADRTAYITAQRHWLAQQAGLNVQDYTAATGRQLADTASRNLQVAINDQTAKVIAGAAAGGATLGDYLGQQSQNQQTAQDAQDAFSPNNFQAFNPNRV